MNKIACAIMVSLSGICLLKGETVPQKTEWKGGRLIYDGVIIKNQFNLPQKGIKYHDEDRLSYDVMDTTIEMSTTLSKNPQCGREWCYKGISHIVVKYSGPISDPIDGGTIYFEPYYNHHISGLIRKSMGNGGFCTPKSILLPESRMRILRMSETMESAGRTEASFSSMWKKW